MFNLQNRGIRPIFQMRWRALATDFDGTIASDGIVDSTTQEAIGRLSRSGVPVILVTGREMKDFSTLDLNLEVFDLIVAENGALLYFPRSGEHQVLGSPPPDDLVAELSRRGVAPISTGASIIATWEPHENVVLQTIKDLGSEHQVIFNKGAVMILPPGINKASGLTAALKRLGLTANEIVGVGDAENDHAFLRLCGLSVAVANAIPSILEEADIVTEQERGSGVCDFINRLLLGQYDKFDRIKEACA